jgi:hypothetical protein
MDDAFPFIKVTNPTWLAYSSLLVCAVYFRFSRVWSVRNLDLVLLLCLSTSLILADAPDESGTVTSETAVAAPVSAGMNDSATDLPAGEISDATAETGARTTGDSSPAYRWSTLVLLGVTLILVLRLVVDESLTRRPRLDQNLNHAGLTFLCIPAFLLPMVGVFLNNPSYHTITALKHGVALLERKEADPVQPPDGATGPAPTETLIAAGGAAVAQLSGKLPDEIGTASVPALVEQWIARILVVIAHALVVAGLVQIGRQHFGHWQLGVAMACLYLLLPCTTVKVHELNQAIPAACLIWAISSYRHPVVSGILLGLASGTLFFAAFLLPLWAVFYGRRGGVKFLVSVLAVTAVLISCLMFTSGDADSFLSKLVTTANWTVYRLLDDTAAGGDASLSQLFIRIPMAAVFFVMLTAMTVLPRPRNLENLLANSTSLIVAAQMWYPDDIGTYVLWYLPLFLLVIFRPRLDKFTPPEMVERSTAALPLPASAGQSATVAMSRISLFR